MGRVADSSPQEKVNDSRAPAGEEPARPDLPDTSSPRGGATWPSLRRLPSRVSPVARLALGTVSLVLVLVAGWLVESARTNGDAAPPVASWLMFALAGLLLVVSCAPTGILAIAAPPNFVQSAQAMPARARLAFNTLRLLAMGCAVGALPLFLILSSNFENPAIAGNWLVNNGSWLLYLLSLLFFASALIVWERKAPQAGFVLSSKTSDPARLPAKVEWSLVTVLTLAAFVLRVFNLKNVPPGLWFDEAQNGYVARGLLAPGAIHPPFISAITQMGALYFYLLGWVDKLLGAGTWQTRLLPALSGTLLVPLLYLMASRLYNWRVGLIGAGLLAVSAWNITFSRYGMASMFTVALDVAVYLLALRALLTGRLGYYAAAGVLLGFTLQVYYIGRLVPFVLIALVVHLYLTQRSRLKAVLRSGLPIFISGALIAGLPVIAFAAENWQIYNGRVSNVSVFSAYGSEGRPDALWTNLISQLLMFNFAGDQNARHNLPGAPSLNWIVASLFWAGLVICVLRVRRWQYFFPIIWFLASLSGGVLSVVWETPHTHRTLENSVVTVLLAGLFLGQLLEIWPRLISGNAILRSRVNWTNDLATRRTLQLSATLGVILLLLICSASMDLPRYFVAQTTNSKTWLQMQAPELRAAMDTANYAQTRTVFLDKEYRQPQPYAYLGLDWSASKEFAGLYALPITATRDVALVLDPSNSKDPDLLRTLYPNAALKPLTAPSDSTALMYTALIPSSDIKALYGVRLVLSGGEHSAPKEGLLIPNAAYTWLISSRGSSLRMETTLKAEEFGSYSFSTGSGTLSIDGSPVSAGQPVFLSVGLHSLVLTDTARINGPAGHVTRLLWQPPGEALQEIPEANLFDPERVKPHGLIGIYRQGTGFGGPVGLMRTDPVISFNSNYFPAPTPYTVEWVGRVYAPSSGEYAFNLSQIGRSTLWLDGTQVVENVTDWKLTGSRDGQRYLSTGWHDLRLRFDPGVEIFRISMEWTPPRGSRSIIPSAYLAPFPGAQAEKIPDSTGP